jgi:hypothetical protein
MAQPQPPFPQPDRDAVATFVDCLFRYADENAFVNLRAFNDRKDGAPPLFVEPINIGAPDFIDRVCARIQQCAEETEPHVFCPPICTFSEPNGATVANLAEGVALSVECDSNPYAAYKKLTAILGRPTAVVISGGMWENPDTSKRERKLHLHWRLTEPTQDSSEHARLYEARALAAEIVGADKTAVALVHPLRWPGSWHRKTDTPRLVRLRMHPDSEIELGEALERLREAHGATAAAQKANEYDREHDAEGRELTAPLDKLAAAMAVLPNDAAVSWETWNRIGMALWLASGGKGFSVFDLWSLKNEKYDHDTTRARWEHYGMSPPDRIGAGTIFHLADQADPKWREAYRTRYNEQKQEAESEEQALLGALARLNRIEYDRQRKQAAKKLGIRPGTLDSEVRDLRHEVEAQNKRLLYPWLGRRVMGCPCYDGRARRCPEMSEPKIRRHDRRAVAGCCPLGHDGMGTRTRSGPLALPSGDEPASQLGEKHTTRRRRLPNA